MTSISDMPKRLENISEQVNGFEKGDPFLKEIDQKLAELEGKLLKGLENDERIKAQKKAS